MILCAAVELFFFKKNSSVATEIFYAVLTFTRYDFGWCWEYIIKQFHAIFCLTWKLFSLCKVIFNSASRYWILLTRVNKSFTVVHLRPFIHGVILIRLEHLIFPDNRLSATHLWRWSVIPNWCGLWSKVF